MYISNQIKRIEYSNRHFSIFKTDTTWVAKAKQERFI
jgi:hypothetical protein